MIKRAGVWFRGLLVACMAMLIFGIALSACLAFILLVVSMETGGPSLSSVSLPLTANVVLLTQGSGFTAGSITLTITPLLLTIGLVTLIRSLALRWTPTMGGCLLGTAAWILINLVLVRWTAAPPLDTDLAVAAKTGACFLIGYLLALLASAGFRERAHDLIWSRIHPTVQAVLGKSAFMSLAVLGACLAIGLVTTLWWGIQYRHSVIKLFTMTRMGTFSAVVTSIAFLAWLPNLAIWAFSWLTGGGFRLGNLATFTLWSGQARNLPSLPFFGLFPDPVTNQGLRTALLALPLAIGLVTGALILLSARGYSLWGRLRRGDVWSGESLSAFILSTAVIILTWALTTAGLALAFQLSGGSLGQERLKRVGVETAAATRTAARGLAAGMMAVWVLVLVAAALIYAVQRLVSWFRGRKTDLPPISGGPDEGLAPDESRTPDESGTPEDEGSKGRPRSVRGSAGSKTG